MEHQSAPHNRAFPANFVWGAATAAYQIEGAATADGRGPSIWDTFAHTSGNTLNGDTGDVACDHYHRWPADIALMQQLGLQAYRFSISWPRIMPSGDGLINEAGLAFYERLVDALLTAGITPWITLYHWDLPQALQDRGGWTNRATADAFAAYTEAVTKRLGDRVRHWITFNEPWCSTFLSYYIGAHAPGHRSLPEALAAVHTTLLAHGKAVPIIRQHSPEAQVGITLNLAQVYAASDSPADQAAARRYDGHFNRWFLDPLYDRGYPADMVALYGDALPTLQAGDLALIAAPTDFLGLNYYAPTFVHDDPSAFLAVGHTRRADLAYTAMDWAIYPEGLYDQLVRLPEEYPIHALYITENGAAYPDAPDADGQVNDPDRLHYYQLHLAAAQRACAAGAPLRGYFAWSLMDNFEWAYGYTKRFGITYVDYATQQRTIKASGHWYRQIIAANAMIMPTASTAVLAAAVR